MSASAAILTSTFRVGRRTVTVTVPRPRPGAVAYLTMEWAPNVPHTLSQRELDQYRRGRDAALAELGVRTLVIEA